MFLTFLESSHLWPRNTDFVYFCFIRAVLTDTGYFGKFFSADRMGISQALLDQAAIPLGLPIWCLLYSFFRSSSLINCWASLATRSRISGQSVEPPKLYSPSYSSCFPVSIRKGTAGWHWQGAFILPLTGNLLHVRKREVNTQQEKKNTFLVLLLLSKKSLSYSGLTCLCPL